MQTPALNILGRVRKGTQVVGLFTVRPYKLTDESWAVIEPLLAPQRKRRPVRDRRQVVNGILWKLSTGAARRGLSEHCGPWKTSMSPSAALHVPRCGPGPPRTQPDQVVADKGYSSARVRTT
ncbi:hypothetical protein GCM10010304_06360 [Streptomyces roseoviolaceus]